MAHTFPNKKEADKQKLRGGYYTPLKLARYLIEWSVRSGDERILEPSCGDGSFVRAVLQHLEHEVHHVQNEIVAVEMDREEIEKARKRASGFQSNGAMVTWICDDFFHVFDELETGKFDIILGNPPFIRFQYFDDASRKKAFGHLKRFAYRPTKLANAWAAFIQLSMELLKTGGRLAMVVPAELLQVTYAAELRARIATSFEHITIIGFKRLVFPEIQQEVVLLLAEGKRGASTERATIHTMEYEDGDDLLSKESSGGVRIHRPAKYHQSGMKWTSFFLSDPAYNALKEAKERNDLTPLGSIADVDVGIVTGRNKFFVLGEDRRKEISACQYTVPIIGKTSALKSIVFDRHDYRAYKSRYPSYLLNLKDIEMDSFPSELKAYLTMGEQHNVHKGYKCSIRKRWFDVPSVYNPDAFMYRQIHNYPLIVANHAHATSTDTIHRVRIRNGISAKKLAAISFNSLTLACAEVCGRSYGGGVLELEPSEAEALPIPFREDTDMDYGKVDDLLREGSYVEALDYVDAIVLEHGMGFSRSMVHLIRRAWTELRDRRFRRR